MGVDERVRILVVDDEPEIRSLFESALESKGYVCDVAESANNAFSQILEKQCQGIIYDLILTDTKMPGMWGTQLVLALRGLVEKNEVKGYENVPIILMSGDNVGDAKKVLMHVNKILIKPITLDTLYDSVDRALSEGFASYP